MKWLFRIVLVAAVIAGVWAGWHYVAAEQVLQVREVEVTRGPLTLAVTTTGRLAPTTEVLVGSEVSGTVEAVLASHNDRVARGDVIARIKPEFYQAEHEQALAELAKATAQLHQLDVQLREAKREYDRVIGLRSSGAATEQEYNIRKTAYEAAEAAVEVGQAAVQAAEGQVRLTQYRLQRAVITSPIDGIVLDRRVDVGQTVAAALQTPVLFVLAEDLAQMELLADVSEADVGYITAGQPVTFTVNTYRDRSFEGRVRQVRNNPNRVADVVTYTVVISVDNSDFLFRPGMPADVNIQVVQRDDVLKVANAALRFRPPLPPDAIRAIVKDLTWPEKPEPIRVLGTQPVATRPGAMTELPPPLEARQAVLWRFEARQWQPVPVWTLYTDNRETAIVAGPAVVEGVAFATEVSQPDDSKNMLQQAIMLAQPENRKL